MLDAQFSRRPVVAVMDPHALRMGDLGERLASVADVVVEPRPDVLAVIDAVVAWQDAHLTRALLTEARRLAVVTHLGTAIHVDVGAATDLGVVVLHNPGQNAASVAEHTMGLLLALAKAIPRSDNVVRRREHWQVGSEELYGIELAGKTMGILGFGAIGRIVARMVSAGFGMDVVVFDHSAAAAADTGVEVVALDDLLRRSDVVSVHLPLTPQTRHLLDRDRIALMKHSALLVHTARAEVVDYEAMNDALRSRAIAGAAFDTWPHHRADPDSPLIDLPNVVMTQHNAGLTRESALRMAQAVVAGIVEMFNGDRPSVSRLANPEVWDRRRQFPVHG